VAKGREVVTTGGVFHVGSGVVLDRQLNDFSVTRYIASLPPVKRRVR
jgi:hypothetical protein